MWYEQLLFHENICKRKFWELYYFIDQPVKSPKSWEQPAAKQRPLLQIHCHYQRRQKNHGRSLCGLQDGGLQSAAGEAASPVWKNENSYSRCTNVANEF